MSILNGLTDIYLFGYPGAGKTTTARYIQENFDYDIVRPGHELRLIAEDPDSEFSRDAKMSILTGKPIPNKLLFNIIKHKLDTKNPIVFDGLQYDAGNFEILKEVMEYRQKNNFSNKTIVLNINQMTSLKRLIARGREDDRIDTIASRIKTAEKNLDFIRKNQELNCHELSNDGIGTLYFDIDKLIIKSNTNIVYSKGIDPLKLKYADFATSSIYQSIHSENQYLGSTWKEEYRVPLFNDLLDDFDDLFELLDIAGRDGYFFSQLNISKARFNIHSVIEVDKNAILKYKERFPTAKIINHDLESGLPFFNNYYGLIIASEIIEHLKHDRYFLSSVYRVLKPGGVFIGSTPNAFKKDHYEKLLKRKDPDTFSDPTHVQYYDPNSLEDTLRTSFPNCEVQIIGYDENNQYYNDLERYLDTMIGYIFKIYKGYELEMN